MIDPYNIEHEQRIIIDPYGLESNPSQTVPNSIAGLDVSSPSHMVISLVLTHLHRGKHHLYISLPSIYTYLYHLYIHIYTIYTYLYHLYISIPSNHDLLNYPINDPKLPGYPAFGQKVPTSAVVPGLFGAPDHATWLLSGWGWISQPSTVSTLW